MVVNRGDDVFDKLDLGYLGQFLGQRINELVVMRGVRAGFTNLRESHGYVIQHLVESNRPVSRTGTELARRMEVSQQAASKVVAELAELGVVEVCQAKDRRAKEVHLSARGWQAVLQARRTRAHIEARLIKRIGAGKYAHARATLQDCLRALGAVERIRTRRVRPPR